MVSLTVVAGGSAQARAAVVDERVGREASGFVLELRASDLPFMRHAGEGIPAQGRVVIRVPDLHEAFPAGQTGGTRCVLTQSAWQLQRWFDWMDRRTNVTLVADADAAALRRVAPEAFDGRGPWSRVDLVELATASSERSAHDIGDSGTQERSERSEVSGRSPLRAAFATESPAERLALCRRAVDREPANPVALVALGSAYMEVQDLDAAQQALERAVAAAPDWEAAHFEIGKLWLRRDDMERASRAFAEAGRLMPGFSAAFSNLGATLGELDRPEDALRAFERALASDPNGYPILNNIGVVSRELGRLPESEAAFRKVVALAPDFVFGHYNLGHTLFLQGRYKAALAAYLEGQRRDPDRNVRQACRLAVVRLAAGDPDGALRDLRDAAGRAPADQRREILAEAQEILWALLSVQPEMRGWKAVADAVRDELEAPG